MEHDNENMAGASSGGTRSDLMTANLREIKTQIADFGVTLDKIVTELQAVPDGKAIDAFRTQVMHKQLYLENLIDETTCELDLLKRDMASLASDVIEIKEALVSLQRGNSYTDDIVRRDTDPVPSIAETLDSDKGGEVLAAIRRHPLSSIPPRQLSESEAMNFLKAIDDIVTKRRNSDFPIPAMSTK